MLFSLSDSKYLKNQLKSTRDSKIFREMIDVQYVLRFFTVRNTWEEFPGNMDVAMDNFMIRNYKNSAANIDEQIQIFKNSLDFSEKIWGNEGFMKPNSSRRVLQGFYDIQMVSASLLSDTERKNAISKDQKVRDGLILLLDHDQTFSDSVTQFTSNAKNVKYRIETFTNFLKAI